MTTIAYKDGIIATDGRITQGGVITDEDAEKRLEVDGIVFWLSGAVCDWKVLAEAYVNGDGMEDQELKVSGLVLDADGLHFISWDGGIYSEKVNLERPRAAGSGTQFALGAMMAGASAEEAVEAAKALDIYSGGTVRSYKLWD
ncbi:peptidase HslV family [Pseudomonas phage KPP10]|uniref:Putative proteasome beta subunit n=1 Tax=Pseudomonas phage KPP10 TaxID=582345 RepID=D6RRT1_BPKPP|nr:peptidase HslV family [Pseudomonas phage KPP10]BAJ09099.1 putative proteasome beta subunit [Pseudomonas phage KPP10]